MMKFFLMIMFMLIMKFYSKMMMFFYNMLFFISFMILMMYMQSIGGELWINVSYFFGCDYYSYLLSLLSLWVIGLMFMSISMDENMKSLKMMMFILMLLLMIFSFMIMNLLMFYFFFEISLIPTFFLVIYWGSNLERINASFYLLMYTLLISFPLLIYLMMMMIYYKSMTFIMLNFQSFLMEMKGGVLMYIVILGAFLIKLPIYFFHIWLPKAHVEAPVYGSMILAAILLKLGGYGLLRMLQIFLLMSIKFNFLIFSVSIVGSLIVSILCIFQIDLKSLVAYSSVVHMNLMLCSLMILMKLGHIGGYMMMIAHGLCSSGMFYMVNIFYCRSSSRLIFLNKGLGNIYSKMMLWWFTMCIINFSFPLSINFISEIMMIGVIMSWDLILMFYLMMISFFSSAYSLYLFSYTFHGKMNQMNIMSDGMFKEYMVLILHIFPLIMMLFNMIMWY